MNMINILWIDTHAKRSHLSFFKGSGIFEKPRPVHAIMWNRAGVVRYFPRSIVTNLPTTIKQLEDLPVKQTSVSPDATRLTWTQGISVPSKVSHELLQLLTL